MYPHPELIEKTLADFPDAAIANCEQGMCLMIEGGYTFLDVRSEPEFESDGNPRGAINIPLIDTKKRWNLETGEITYEQTANPNFVAQVEKKFPNKETDALLIVCSTGTARAIQCLQLLDEAGYVNIVGLKGGFNKWSTMFTPKLDRRGTDVKYTTVYQSDGDALGVHTTGAGFGKTDYVDFNLNSVDNTDWIDWEETVKANA
jgi:rhodanese-related sulfurtransferase